MTIEFSEKLKKHEIVAIFYFGLLGIAQLAIHKHFVNVLVIMRTKEKAKSPA